MSTTRLTIGGFTQAGVARNLIEMPANSEKGLSHRFLWTFPKPLFGNFAALAEVNKKFTEDMCKLLQIVYASLCKSCILIQVQVLIDTQEPDINLIFNST